ncbi:hypothetical protein [Candidatus Protochlamydia phocaeensis]|uniref:hypothetical protein n=1 Tax=Candidatus Protochlamydia phocaeensis TaxID=1414722 RepID=UPI0008393137|nr:hypothetical protein [Candidatus Protochlamydia phocaeensis]
MGFIFAIVLFVFIVGLIVSNASIRHIFLSGLKFLFISILVISFIILIIYKVENSRTKKSTYTSTTSTSSNYDYYKAQKAKKLEAEKVKNELFALIKTMFHDDICYQAWNNPTPLIGEIYRKYQEDLEWQDISPIELLILIDNKFAEIGGNEVVIFHKERVWVGLKEVPSWSPIVPIKRNDSVRKTNTLLSQYYYGPQIQKSGYKVSGYLAAIQFPRHGTEEARKRLEYRRQLNEEEQKKYNSLASAYKSYKAEGFYKD